MLLELVNKLLIITGMKNFSHPGRRARQIAPSLSGQVIALADPSGNLSDDQKFFWMTFAGGLVFFGTFFS